jgi:hypothetical protein
MLNIFRKLNIASRVLIALDAAEHESELVGVDKSRRERRPVTQPWG